MVKSAGLHTSQTCEKLSELNAGEVAERLNAAVC